jgi:hypothetical protein
MRHKRGSNTARWDKRWGKRWSVGLLAAIALACWAPLTYGQNTNEILSVDPDNAAQGAYNLLVTFVLDSDTPPPPPAGVLPDSVTIGSLMGRSITHDNQTEVTAVFDIPEAELIGPKDAAVTFTTPHGTLIFSAASIFEVTLGEDSAPIILQHPQPKTAPPGSSVTFSVLAGGTPPLTYQWQKDEVDLDGATDASLTLDLVTTDDAGAYGCVVTNDIGSTTSDEAVLTIAVLPAGAYAIVDTGQDVCFDDEFAIVDPLEGQDFYGQDAQYEINAPSYALGPNGLTVFDNQTGLIWQRSPDVTGDGEIDINDKLTFEQALAYPAQLNSESFAGRTDWRLPTIKELYSLIDFRGMDPTMCETEGDCPGLRPFIDETYFDFGYGDTDAGERVIDSQWATSTLYVSMVDGQLLFGVNFADGRIKGYWLTSPNGDKLFYVICVCGNEAYGENHYLDLANGTILDRATGLVWRQEDSGYGMFWEDALAYAEDLLFADAEDWRLPSVKELHSILDYSRAPDISGSAAIDPVFSVTEMVNEEGVLDYPYYWSSTTHISYPDHGQSGSYVAFGRGLGYMNNNWLDVHGAGCQRSDPKYGDPADYPYGHGPQGDAIRIYNYVRPVRGPFCPQDVDLDGDIDLDDAAWQADCMTGPDTLPAPGCQTADTDGDGDVDLADTAELLNAFGGFDVDGYPGCR